MTKRFPLGLHELRIFSIEPLLVYVRFVGDLAASEARSLMQRLAAELDGCGSRFLVDAAALGSICPDSRRELMMGGASLHLPGPVADIVLVGASMLQKVVLAQIVSAAGQSQEFHGQTHFFDSLEDALGWLGVPRSLLASAEGASI